MVHSTAARDVKVHECACAGASPWMGQRDGTARGESEEGKMKKMHALGVQHCAPIDLGRGIRISFGESDGGCWVVARLGCV